ncbi:uncharacterized protein [Palaemon carinicauda]|uniref:uncharacterized protein n=1 Tax=Palaemon carinicauda TaxID=392227 RepID=UPI0035B5D124
MLFYITCFIPLITDLVFGDEAIRSTSNTFLQDQCKVEADNPGTFQVLCACKNSETLTVSEADTQDLPSTVTGFHVSNCNDSTVVLKSKALNHFPHLERIMFSSINSVRLEPNSINLHLFHRENFALTFENILGLGLSLEENSVKIQRVAESATNESIEISNSIVSGFPKYAINGSLTQLRLHKILLTERAQSESIDVGETGTAVIIDVLETLNGGLEAKWLLGNLNDLQVTRSSILLRPNAFEGIKMRGSPLTIRMSHNDFGPFASGPDTGSMNLEPSLPTGVFDIDATFTDVSVTAENNRINCTCKDLIWIRENPDGFLQNRLNFICEENITMSEALGKCLPLDPNSSDGSRVSLTLLATLFVSFTFTYIL